MSRYANPHEKSNPVRPSNSWGIHTLRAACAMPQGHVRDSINQSFIVRNGDARFSRRELTPVESDGETTATALAALRAHATAHARAVLNGEPTVENPNRSRRAWEGKRAA